MKIAISGTQCIGKTTFIQDFIKEWPMYTVAKKSYRDLIQKKGLNHSKHGTEEAQRTILNALIDDQQAVTKEEAHVVFDRCVFDNLVYTMWLNAQNKVSDSFVQETILLVKESLTVFDIVFFDAW